MKKATETLSKEQMTNGYPKANQQEFVSFLYIFIQVKGTKP